MLVDNIKRSLLDLLKEGFIFTRVCIEISIQIILRVCKDLPSKVFLCGFTQLTR